MQRFLSLLSAGVLVASLTGCLGTIIETPVADGRTQTNTRAHIIAAPRVVDASECRAGLSKVATFIPIWGVIVGILTFGILVPMSTSYTCAATQ
jgi:hypothetical protein